MPWCALCAVATFTYKRPLVLDAKLLRWGVLELGHGRVQVTRSEAEGGSKVELSLITDGSGAGRGGGKQADALPPLMPGLPARRGGSE